MDILIYIVIGLVLCALCTYQADDGTEPRCITHPGYILLFVPFWPILVCYLAYVTYRFGRIKWNGKVIYSASERKLKKIRRKYDV